MLQIHLQPRAAKDAIVGATEHGLRIRLTSPPTDGQANDHLIRLLARLFGVKKGLVRLLSGASSRHKTVLISSVRKKIGDSRLVELLGLNETNQSSHLD